MEKLKQRLWALVEQERRKVLEFAGNDRGSVEDIYQALLEEAQQTAGVYPEFDLQGELENGEFVSLLRAGLPVRRAYETVHHQEMVESALAYGMAQALPRRPGENGLDAAPAAGAPGGMAGTTRQERDAIRARAARGEIVRL